MTRPAPLPEFTRPIDIDRVGNTEVVHEIAANAQECAALARRFDLVGIERLEARVRLRRARGGSVLRLAARLTADAIQSCVVTLAPVTSHVEAEFTVLYGDGETGGEGIQIDPDSESTLEPWPEGPLDLGETVAQEFALALEPYPRAPGVALDPPWQPKADPGDDAEKVNPFAVLEKLRRPPK
jgi:uncharacterized metal-binding protein YceD (DUF177 family)